MNKCEPGHNAVTGNKYDNFIMDNIASIYRSMDATTTVFLLKMLTA